MSEYWAGVLTGISLGPAFVVLCLALYVRFR